jgi:hypothetical protein
MKKRSIIYLTGLLLLAIFIVIPGAKSETKPFYSGEAISFNNKIFIGSTNGGKFELFKFENNKLSKKGEIVSDDLIKKEFHDCLFKIIDNNLYIFLVNGSYLYKYQIFDQDGFKLIGKMKDNSWDYMYGLADAYEDNIMTAGTKGVKVWSKDLEVINSYDLITKNVKSLKFSNNGNYLFAIENGNLEIIDATYHNIVMEGALEVKEDHSRLLFNDDTEGAVYVVDDKSLKKVFFNGEYEEFVHISNLGYDVDGMYDSDHLYFSDGYGIVKIRKNNLQPITWAYTTDLGVDNGWAMTMRVVRMDDKEYVVVFNNSGILVLDDSLKLKDYYKSVEIAINQPQRELYLSVDKNRAAPGSSVSLLGGGFGIYENIKITFKDDKYYTISDQNGSFKKVIKVPSMNSGTLSDIKAVGEVSGLTYSMSFKVE